MKNTLLISLFSITSLLNCAQSEELVYWDSQSTFTYSYPQAGDSLAAVVTAASQTPSGLTPYQYVDSRNIWYNPNSNLVVNPSADPYLEFVLNLNSAVDFDRFIIHGLAPASGNGDIGVELRWDVDNYASALGNFTPHWSDYRLTSVDIGGQASVPAGTVTFRLYYYKVAGLVYHSDSGPHPSSDGTPSSYSSYWRCFSVCGEPACIVSGTDTQSTCGSFTWIDGNTYTSSTNSPTHTLLGGGVNGCDSIVTLDLTITSASTSTTIETTCSPYTWNGTDYISSGTYTWTGQNHLGCDSTATLDLTINTVSDITTTIGSNNVTITANNSNASYQWVDCDSNFAIILNETDSEFTALENGNYAVQLTENGCVDTTECVAINAVGIVENDFGMEFMVYPNPTDGKFSIDLGTNYKLIHLTLTDITGKVLQDDTYEGLQLLDLVLDEPRGVYLLFIKANEKKATIRLIKE
ncbi:T9SS type A sorting domain-containing protein [Crocinitomicaceae bacterium]|nr:T9SS type A sorting domain-containing protein [Crocinitomicaceae bacterium]